MPDQLKLLEGEELIRIDFVFFERTSSTAFWPYPQDNKGALMHGGYAKMVLTTRRLVFLPGVSGWLGRLQTFLYLVLMPVGMLVWGRPLYLGHQAFDLRDIERFHTWKPEFSGPPGFEIGTSSWIFGLVTNRRAFKFAPEAAMRAHFTAVEAAWQAARATPPTEGSSGASRTSR
jgi:hypothetical protein